MSRQAEAILPVLGGARDGAEAAPASAKGPGSTDTHLGWAVGIYTQQRFKKIHKASKLLSPVPRFQTSLARGAWPAPMCRGRPQKTSEVV